jgi:hypothetical protein
LNFHTTEFDTPSDGRIDWRWFEAHRLPVGRLDVLEVVHRGLVVLIYPLTEHDQWISDEQMSDVFGQGVVNP